MSYRDTARRFASSTYDIAAPEPATIAAEELPMSEWAEARRDTMTPQTIAWNHALHVQEVAQELREALDRDDHADIEDAARALLSAIGEGESLEGGVE